MIQRFLYTTLKTGLETIRDNPIMLADIFDQYDLSTEEMDAIKTWLTTQFPTIKHQYARTDDNVPLVSIILGSEQEADHYIGDFAKQEDDGSEIKSSLWEYKYEFWIYDKHPDGALYLYELVKAVMVVAPLQNYGLYQTHFSGQDLANDMRYVPEHLFARKFVFTCRQEYERLDRDARLGKAWKVAGIHVDKAGSPSDVGGVRTLVTIAEE